jgi:GT2 family glycosyltransferase
MKRTADTPRYDLILPHYGTGRLTGLCLRCLKTIRRHSADYRLIFIDNASPEFDAVESELRRHRHLLIRNTENLGFVRAVNQGLKRSTAERVVILNNDTEAVPHWLSRLDAALAGNVGISGPRTTANSWQGRYPAGDGILVLPANAMLAFFCVMIRRDVVRRVGLLDEQFGVGFGDDDDYCHRAQTAGFRLALVLDLVIPHHHRSTFRTLYSEAEIRAMQQTALKKFQAKSARQAAPPLKSERRT